MAAFRLSLHADEDARSPGHEPRDGFESRRFGSERRALVFVEEGPPVTVGREELASLGVDPQLGEVDVLDPSLPASRVSVLLWNP